MSSAHGTIEGSCKKESLKLWSHSLWCECTVTPLDSAQAISHVNNKVNSINLYFFSCSSLSYLQFVNIQCLAPRVGYNHNRGALPLCAVRWCLLHVQPQNFSHGGGFLHPILRARMMYPALLLHKLPFPSKQIGFRFSFSTIFLLACFSPFCVICFNNPFLTLSAIILSPSWRLSSVLAEVVSVVTHGQWFGLSRGR